MMVNLIIMPLIFLAGVFYPVNNVPVVMAFISKIDPLTYGVDAIRQIFLGSEAAGIIGITIFGHTMSILEDVAVVMTIGLVLMSLAVLLFNRSE